MQRWNLVQMAWNIDLDSELGPCRGSGISEGRSLSVSVFDASHLPTLIVSDLEPTDVRQYRSGVLVSLTTLP